MTFVVDFGYTLALWPVAVNLSSALQHELV